MTRRGSADVPFFLIDGFSVLGALTHIDVKAEAILEEVTALGDAWKVDAYVGVRQAEITQDGFYDDAVGDVHEALSTGPGVSRIMCFGLEGTATGAEFVGWAGAMQVDYQRIAKTKEFTKAKATYKSNGWVDHGKILRSLGTVTATAAATGTPVDNLVSSTGAAAYLQYTSGGESEVSILHSSDDITYATIISFACSTGTRGANRQVVTGVIERYTAVNWSTGAVSGTTSFRFFAGIARGRTS